MEAFREMFVPLRPKFVAMAQAILRNREDAEDAVQDACLSAHLHLGSFGGRSALRTWFTRIVLNAALMIRRKRNSRFESLPESGMAEATPWPERIPDSQPDPEMVHAERETIQVIDEMLGKIKPALRQAFTMTYYEELSGAEACVRLGVSAGTFKSRVFRARRYLANHWLHSLLAAPQKKMPLAFFSSVKNGSQSLARPTDNSSSEIALS